MTLPTCCRHAADTAETPADMLPTGCVLLPLIPPGRRQDVVSLSGCVLPTGAEGSNNFDTENFENGGRERMARAKKPEHGFETFDAVIEALAPKRTAEQRRRTRVAANKWRRRKARAEREAKREAAQAVHRLTRSLSLDRPHIVETSSLGFAAMRGEAVGRWWRCLELMGSGEWTLRALEGVWSLDKATAHSVLRTLQKRALVSRYVNPCPGLTPIAGGFMAGKANRVWGDRWLYRATERAALVLSGAVSWRRDSHGRPIRLGESSCESRAMRRNLDRAW